MPTPTTTELIFLKQVWSLKKASARELHNAALDETRWSYSSTRKTLDRMVTKELLNVSDVHGLMVYSASNPKLKTLADLITGFARDVLNTKTQITAAAFGDSSLLNDDELDDLQQLLDDMSDDKGEPAA